MNIPLNDRLKEITLALFDIQYTFEGSSDNHYKYFKFTGRNNYTIKLSVSKDYVWIYKNRKVIAEGSWDEIRIIEQIGKIFVGDSHFIGDAPKV